MTACENSEAVEKAMSNGASAFLNKPFDLDNLVNLIQNTSRKASHAAGKKTADSTVLFARNQPVMLDIQNGRCSGHYPSTIQEKSDSWLTVMTPKKGDDYVDLAPRTPVKVGLAAKDAFYSFSSQVVCQQAQPVPVLVLDKPGVIYRTQRRQTPRVALPGMPVRYARIEEGDRDGMLSVGRSRDVGIGGIGFLSEEEIAPGQLIYVETDAIAELGSINAVGHVLRCRRLGLGEREEFDIGVEFTGVDDKLKLALV
jgi:c-di-GMP-binding flagellar brake protein YcgR